jgi:hypothetical protein
MDKETATRQLAAITQALEDTTKDLKAYSLVVQDGTTGKNLEDFGKISESYDHLLASVRSLNRAARGPVDLLWAHIEHVCTRNTEQVTSVTDMVADCACRGGEGVARDGHL